MKKVMLLLSFVLATTMPAMAHTAPMNGTATVAIMADMDALIKQYETILNQYIQAVKDQEKDKATLLSKKLMALQTKLKTVVNKMTPEQALRFAKACEKAAKVVK